jgi:hypothetical protein
LLLPHQLDDIAIGSFLPDMDDTIRLNDIFGWRPILEISTALLKMGPLADREGFT